MPWEETLTGDDSKDGGGVGGGGGGELTVADSQYTFSVPDLLRRQAHRDQYHAYLKDARNHRKRGDLEKDRRRRGLADSDDPNSVDMGMQPRSGLHAPIPRLPESKDPLWLEQPLTEDGGAPRRRVKRTFFGFFCLFIFLSLFVSVSLAFFESSLSFQNSLP